jgi:hypothetical protein
VITGTALRVLRSESEVTQICTPGDDSILIAGTIHGSLVLYDLKEFDQNNINRDEGEFMMNGDSMNGGSGLDED